MTRLRQRGVDASTPRIQGNLFGAAPDRVEPAQPAPMDRELAGELPAELWLGTMSWSYPGWHGSVYRDELPAKRLAEHGLSAYAEHPLFRAVEIDRSYYEPLTAERYRWFAEQVPEHFRFVVKAHEDTCVSRFPSHARYGRRRGEQNPRYLDAAYASEAVIAPTAAGLDAKLGAVLFQFPPLPPQDAGPPQRFAERLHDFLTRLPKGITYAVELRTAELFTADYAHALADAGAVHCHNVWTAMPPLIAQVKRIPPEARSPLIVRWLLRRGHRYEDALARAAPFARIVSEDGDNRIALARLAAKAVAHRVSTLVLVDNKAEGCAPESIRRLARAIVDEARADFPTRS